VREDLSLCNTMVTLGDHIALHGVHLYGSDPLGPWEITKSQEFEIRLQVLPAVESLRSTTISAARMMGIMAAVRTD
jgi:uncharacterized protein (DUF58 family)